MEIARGGDDPAGAEDVFALRRDRLGGRELFVGVAGERRRGRQRRLAPETGLAQAGGNEQPLAGKVAERPPCRALGDHRQEAVADVRVRVRFLAQRCIRDRRHQIAVLHVQRQPGRVEQQLMDGDGRAVGRQAVDVVPDRIGDSQLAVVLQLQHRRRDDGLHDRAGVEGPLLQAVVAVEHDPPALGDHDRAGEAIHLVAAQQLIGLPRDRRRTSEGKEE
jgi:hypothetical protein